MNRLIVLAFLSVFLVQCSDDPEIPCQGFHEEPGFRLSSSYDSFGVHYFNPDRSGDTVFTTSGVLYLPMDPNSDTMHYHYLKDTVTLDFSIVYENSVFYCESNDALMTRLNTAHFFWDQDSFDLVHVTGIDTTLIDQNISYHSELNSNRNDSHFHIIP